MSGDGAASPQPCPGTPPDTGALGLRPLTARSVILSVLLGSHPPVLPVRSLVRTAALFGINEGTTRVALSRLAGDGDVVVEGRQYRLNDRLIDRQRQQDESRAPATRPWRGHWEMVLLEPAQVDPALQAAVGAQLTRLKLGEFRPGVWMRPANLRRPWPPQHRGQGWYLNARTVLGGSDGPELAARIWDLTAWGRSGRSPASGLGRLRWAGTALRAGCGPGPRSPGRSNSACRPAPCRVAGPPPSRCVRRVRTGAWRLCAASRATQASRALSVWGWLGARPGGASARETAWRARPGDGWAPGPGRGRARRPSSWVWLPAHLDGLEGGQPDAERPPQGQIARILQVGRDPAGRHQLVVQRRQLPPRNATVDVMRQVPTGVVGHHPEAGQRPLAYHVSRLTAVGGALHAPMFGDGSQAVEGLSTPSTRGQATAPDTATTCRCQPRRRPRSRPGRRGCATPTAATMAGSWPAGAEPGSSSQRCPSHPG